MNIDKGFGENLRVELGELFGIRWDSFVEWTVIAWLSAWFWVVALSWELTHGDLFPGRASDEPFRGPIAAGRDFMLQIAIDPPDWLELLLGWLRDPGHAWIYWVALFVSVICCVTAARSYDHTGLRVLSMIAAAIACEINGSIKPAAWVILIAAAPALIACAIFFIGQIRGVSKYGRSSYYYAGHVLIKFTTGIVLMFVRIPLAPFFLAWQLVISFRTEIPKYAAAEISKDVTRLIEAEGVSEGGALDSVSRAALNASLALAGNRSPEARAILNHYAMITRMCLESPIGSTRRVHGDL
jgi:hypothetical protein